MCGVAGVVGLVERDRAPAMRAMREAIVHRGPDSAGEYLDTHAALGVRRLRIIDLATGDQPQCDESRNVWTVFNGEIYNYRELRSELRASGHRFATESDTEVIVHLYEEHGHRFVERLDGMFAVALWDARERKLILARDRLGKKPLLYRIDDGELFFASEHQALLSGLSGRPVPDRGSIALYLRLGYVPAPSDAFAGVEKLGPAEILVWVDGAVSRERYWAVPEDLVEVGPQEAAAEVRRLFDQAVARRLMSDVPLGVFLSGGLDSSAVVASMAAQTARVSTFTIGFEEREYSELAHARRVAERFGTDHHELIVRPDILGILPTLVRHYGEPYADSSAIPTYYLARMARERVTVALGGDGGDELFGGYARYRAMAMAEKLDRIPGPIRRGAWSAVRGLIPDTGSERSAPARLRRFARGIAEPPASQYTQIAGIFAADRLIGAATPEFRSDVAYAEEELGRRAGAIHGDAVSRAQRLDLSLYLPDDLLVKVDIASMANSLEVRAPFLDRQLVEYAMRLPTRLKIRAGRGKWILRQAFADVLLPETVARGKQGFGLPIGAWLRTSLRPLLDDVILSPAALSRGYLTPAAVRELVHAHLRGVDHTHRLWSLVMLELWHREYIDSEPSP
jgi:asparagine synthase (glutamine-hydrolysing)